MYQETIHLRDTLALRHETHRLSRGETIRATGCEGDDPFVHLGVFGETASVGLYLDPEDARRLAAVLLDCADEAQARDIPAPYHLTDDGRKALL